MSFTSLGPIAADGVRLPLCSFKVPAGFPSPAADHIEKEISLDELLGIRAPHVYLVRIDGDSMQGVGIYSGDLAVFQPGFRYSKAEVQLLDLRQPGEFSDDLFAVNQPAEASRVMAVLDAINGRWGRGTLRAASVPGKPDWGMRREMMSQSYTTRVDQLWQVSCK